MSRRKSPQAAREAVFDAGAYRDSLAALLKAAQDEYKQITYDRRAMQHSILRNYLWLSTILFSVGCTGVYQVAGHSGGPWRLDANALFWLFSAASLLASFACFCLGIDTMRGRGIVFFPYQGTFEELLDMAYREASRELSSGRLALTMTRDLEEAINHHRATATTVGKKLRYIAWGLIFSSAMAALAFFSAVLGGHCPAVL